MPIGTPCACSHSRTLMNKPAINWDELARAASTERRRGKRLNLVYAIEIRGMNSAGECFIERTKTQDISEFGCRIETEMPLSRGDVIAIKLLAPDAEDSEPQLFEIIWTLRDPTGGTAGARKL